MKSEKELFIERVKQELDIVYPVLDLGCMEEYAEGKSVHNDLLNEGFDARGVDIAPGTDIQADLNKDFPIATESYKQILAMEIIEHIDNPTHFLKECHRILKPGGKLILTTPHAPSVIQFAEAYKEVYDDKDQFPHIHYLDTHCISRLFKKTGFELKLIELHGAHFNRNFLGRFIQRVVKGWRSNILAVGIKK